MRGFRFRDRTQAGEFLAAQLTPLFANRADVLVLALPRGGVPVGAAIARALRAPLDVIVVRKLGAPDQPEWAVGAIASGGVRVLNPRAVKTLRLETAEIDAIAARETVELERRERAYRDGRVAAEVRDKTLILVDDGLATGTTVRAAVCALREREPAEIVVAVPVGAVETCHELRVLADAVFCAQTPMPFFAVGEWYENFSQTTDDEVRELLRSL